MDLAKWLKKGKKQIQGVVAQVIPGGENYKSVVNNKPVNRPAPTYGPQQAPQQQFNQTPTLAPSFNKPPSINQNGRNRIGGIDIQAPTISKPEANKVDEVIRKQQRQSIQDLTDKFNRGEINKQQRQAAAEGVLGSQKKEFVKLGGVKGGLENIGKSQTQRSLLGGVAELGNMPLRAGQFTEAVREDAAKSSGLKRAAYTLNPVTAPSALAPRNIAQQMAGKAQENQKKLDDLATKLQQGIQANPALQQREDDNLGGKVLRAAPNLGAAAGLTIATGGATAPALFGLSQAGEVYDNAQDKGFDSKADQQKALLAAGASGIAEAALENIGLKSLGLGGEVPKLIRPLAGSIPGRAVSGFLSEGMQEGAQEFSGNVFNRVAGGDERKLSDPGLLENVKDAALIGGLLGGPANVVTGSGNTNQNTPQQAQQQQAPKVDPQVKQQLDSPDPVVQQTAQDKIAGQTLPKVTEMPTVQGMQERMRAAKQNVQKFNADLGQGGFIAGPLAGDFSNQQQQGKVFEGVDGKPRFEVDDSGATWKNFYNSVNNGEPQKLGDIFKHNKLFEQYPQLKDVTVKFDKSALSDGTKGQSGKGGIKLHTASFSGDGAMLAEDMRGTLLHEIQHQIQDVEGFAGGGAPVQADQAQINAIQQNLKENYAVLDRTADPDTRRKIISEIDRLESQLDQALDAPIKDYKKGAGEAEARAVAARKDMTDGERYAKPEMLDSLNPTGGLMVDYDPQSRVSTNLAENMTTLDKTLGGSPDDKITIYRGVDNEYNQSSINPGDFITDMPELAQSYTGDGNIIEMEVRKGDVIDDANEPGGNEYIYRPNADKESRSSAKPKSTFYDSLDVPKEDLIIRDGKGKAMSVEPNAPTAKTDPQASLKQEAKKYKSAEEFRKNLVYNDNIIIHQTGKSTADKIKAEGFKSGKETGLGEKRSEVYGMTAYDWNKHSKFSKDTYARDGSDVAEVAIDIKGLKIADRTKQKFTDEEYVKGTHKQIPDGYDGVKVGYGNGVNEVLLKPEVANARRFNIDDLYTQSQPPKSTLVQKQAPQPTKVATPFEKDLQAVGLAPSPQAKGSVGIPSRSTPKKPQRLEVPSDQTTELPRLRQSKANPTTETNITDPKLADNKIDTDDLKTERPQAYKMIDELSRELRDIDSANGVELIEPSVDAAYSATDDTYRASTNTPFYKQHYKDTGRKPTLGHYRDEARRILSGGTDNSYGVVGPDQVAEFNHALVEQPSTEAYANTPEAIELDTQAKLENEVKELRKQAARKPLSTPVDTTPAIAKRVTQKSNKTAKTYRQNTNQGNQNDSTVIRPQKQNNQQNQKQVAEETQVPPKEITPKKQQLTKTSQVSKKKNTPLPPTVELNTVDVNDPFNKKNKLNQARNEWGELMIDEDTQMINMLKRIEKETGRTDLVDNWMYDSNNVRGSRSIANSKIKSNKNIKEAMYGLTAKQQGKFDEYIAARSELSNIKNGLKTTSKNQSELQNIVSKGDKEFSGRFDSLNKYYADWGKQFYEAGIITKEKQQAWAKNKDYVRIQRDMDDLFNWQGGSGKSRSFGTTSTTKKRTGSKREILSPTNVALQRGQELELELQRNKASTRNIDTLQEFGLAKLTPTDQAVNKNVIKRFKDGKLETYEVHKDIKEVVENLNPYQMGVLLNVVAAPTRTFKAGTTGLSVPFALMNYTRDQGSSALYSSNVRATHSPLNIISGFKNAAQDFATESTHPLWSEFEKVAGDQTMFDATRNVKSTKAINRELRQGTKGKTINKVLNPLRTLEDAIGVTEQATRFQNFKGTYDAAIKDGKNHEAALQLAGKAATDNSVNFARAGKMMRVLNMIFPYSNAAIQGSRNTAKAFRDRPMATTMKSVAYTAIPTLLLTMLNYDDDETRKIYENINETEKKDNFIVILPGAKQNEKGVYEGVFKIPKPQGYRELTDPIRVVTEKFAGIKTSDDISDMILDAMTAFTGPLDITDKNKAISTFIPQAIKPTIQADTNKDYYWGSQTVPEYMIEGTDDPTKRAYKSTSGSARIVADQLGVSPILVEKFIEDTTGSVGRYGIRATDRLLSKMGAIPKEQIGGRSVMDDIKRRTFEARSVENLNKSDGRRYYDNVEAATKDLPKHLQDSWKSYNTSNKNFLGEELFEKNGQAKKQAKAAAYIEHPELFAVDKKIDAAGRKKGEAGNPLYDLSYNQALMVVQEKALPPGAKDDGLSTLYDQEWYSKFKNNESKFYEKIFGKGGKEEKTDNPYPERSTELVKAMDYYYDLPSSSAKSSWKKANPEIASQMDGYYDAKSAWTNTERAKLGLPPIEDKYGKYAKSGSSGGGRGRGRGRGRGGRGGRGGGSNAIAKSLASSYKLQADTLGKLTQLLNSTTKKPTAGMNAGKKVVTKKPNLKKITVNMSSKG